MGRWQDLRLSSKWPHLFLDGKPYEFPVGDGWHDLCAKTFGKVAKALKKKGVPLTECHVMEIKEKFGGLRISLGAMEEGAYDVADPIIRAAEDASFHICEVCGEEGRLRDGAWWRTLCDIHNNAQEGEDI